MELNLCKVNIHAFCQQVTRGQSGSWQPVWPTDVLCLAPELFGANVTDLPALKKQMISYQRVRISGCWKSLAMLDS